MGTIHDVSYYDNLMLGAPVSEVRMNAAGKMIEIFDAVLVNGFNVQAVASIMVQGGVATVTTMNADNGFRDHQRVRIEGASPPELNGDWKVTTTGGNTFTFPTPAPNGAATGTISAKTAPLGWTKDFSATNVAVYRPKTGLRHYFRVNDTALYQTSIRGYEEMTGSGDGGSNPFPLPTQLSLGVQIVKGSLTNNFPRWTVVGDDRAVYFISSPGDHLGIQQESTDYACYGFGEIISYVPDDLGCSFVAGHIGNVTSFSADHAAFNGLNYPGYTAGSHHFSGCYLSRQYSQELGLPRRFRIAGSGLMAGWGSSRSADERIPYPNPADLSALFHTPIHVQEESSNCVRGELPGPYQLLHAYSSFRIGDIHTVNGRKILLTRGYDNSTASNHSLGRAGVMGWDITGPWR